jgi:hypothetical protein
VRGGYRYSLSCGKAESSEMSHPRFMNVVEWMRNSSACPPLRAYRAAMSSSDVAEQQASWDRGQGRGGGLWGCARPAGSGEGAWN